MMRALAAVFSLGLLAATHCLAADGEARPNLSVVISEGSIQINHVELRTEPPAAKRRYLSLEAAEKALGRVQSNHAGEGVREYGWRDAGIDLLKGLRGAEEGNIFKFHVWFVDYYDKTTKRHSGVYQGHVRLDGVDIGPETTFDTIREELKKNGYAVGDSASVKWANKGEVSVFTVSGKSNKIQRIEIWVQP